MTDILVNRDGGPHKLVEAVLISYIELIMGNTIFENNTMVDFHFPKLKMPHEKTPKKERDRIRAEYKEKKDSARLDWYIRRNEWLEDQIKWVIQDGFWFNAFEEYFGYNPSKSKDGFIALIRKKMSSPQTGLTRGLK